MQLNVKATEWISLSIVKDIYTAYRKQSQGYA